MRVGRLASVAHQRAHHGGRDPQHGDPVTFHDRPETIGAGVIGDAFEQHQGGADGQRSADRPGTHHPADVGEPEQPVGWAHVEAVRHVLGGLDGKPPCTWTVPFGRPVVPLV